MTEAVELRHGDALLLLREIEDESIDAVITDPPYSSGGMFRGDRARNTGEKYVQAGQIEQRPDFDGDSRDQRGYLAWCSLWMAECLRVVKPGRPILCFTDWRQLPVTTDAMQVAGFVWRGIVPWDKRNARPRLGFLAQAEFIVWGTRGPTDLGHDAYLPGVMTAAVREDGGRWHQTSKPLGLMERLVEIVPPGSLILDPFAGSSSTLVSCTGNRGRRGLGFEINVDYLEASGKRLDQLSLGTEAA